MVSCTNRELFISLPLLELLLCVGVVVCPCAKVRGEMLSISAPCITGLLVGFIAARCIDVFSSCTVALLISGAERLRYLMSKGWQLME